MSHAKTDRPPPDPKLDGATIAITGVSGFIGGRLARRLAARAGLRLRFLVRATSNRSGLDDMPADMIVGDLEDEPSLEALVRDADYVLHLAGLTRARSRAAFLEANARGTERLARAAARHAPGLRRLVLMSSLAAVGPTRDGKSLTEDSPARPVTWYGESKLAGEAALAAGLDASRWTILRPPAVYGPGERDLYTVFRMVRRRLAPVLGLGTKHYSFVYVDDLVDALLASLSAPETAGRRYFVAEPTVRTNLDLMAAIESALGVTAFKPRIPHALAWALGAVGSAVSPLLARPPLLTLQRLRELTPPRWVCDPGPLERDAGHRCSTGLEDGVRATADWYREHGWL